MSTNSTNVDEFFTQNYPSLLSFCQNRWNGNGEDILHETYLILRERYTHVNFSLFCLAAREAARALGLHRRELPLHENIPQQQQKKNTDPRLERLREVLVYYDPEEVIQHKDIKNRIKAEYFGQLRLFGQFNEEGR